MTGTPTIGVLALQGDVREHLAMLRGAGADAVPVRRDSELAGVDGIVLPGGESTTMHRLTVAFDVFESLRARIRDGLPALGTCAGMIMLADRIEGGAAGQETIGGLDVTVRRNAFGRQVDSFEADVEFAVLGQHDRSDRDPSVGPGVHPLVHAVFIRAPWVEKVGEGVDILARVASGASAGRIVAVQQGHLLATSFHPEITGDDRVHRHFVGLVRRSGSSTSVRPSGEG